MTPASILLGWALLDLVSLALLAILSYPIPNDPTLDPEYRPEEWR